MCNGHADTCHVQETKPTRILACQCRHHTCGIQCNECCPGYEQKKWHQNTKARSFQCERKMTVIIVFGQQILTLIFCIFFSQQLAIVLVIQILAFMMNRLMNKDYHWISLEIMRVVVFVRIVYTIQWE